MFFFVALVALCEYFLGHWWCCQYPSNKSIELEQNLTTLQNLTLMIFGLRIGDVANTLVRESIMGLGIYKYKWCLNPTMMSINMFHNIDYAIHT